MSVGLACVAQVAGNGAESSPVIFSERKRVPKEKEEMNGAALAGALRDTLSEIASENIARMGRVEEIVVTFGSPWYSARIGSAERDYPKPTRITQEELSSLAATARNQVEDVPEGKRVDDAVIAASVNGYRTRAPRGKEGAALSLTVFQGFVEPFIFEKIQTVCEWHFGDTKLTVRTAALPFVDAVSHFSEAGADAFLVTVTGKSTDALVIRNGALIERFAIPHGTQTVLESLAEEGESRRSAASKLQMYLDGDLEAGVNEAAEKKLRAVEKEWVSEMAREALARARSAPLPTSAYLLTERQTRPWFARALSRLDFAPATLTNEPFHVLPLEHKLFPEGDLYHAVDLYLFLSVLYHQRSMRQGTLL